MQHKWSCTLVMLLIVCKSFPQYKLFSSGLEARLDSISMNTGKERHFAELYFKTTIVANNFIATLPVDSRQMMKTLEENFAEYFFRAIDAVNSGDRIPTEWKYYFSVTDLSSLQLKLLGANAHINGDIWQAMISTFSLEEIKKLKPIYKTYNRWLDGIYKELYNETLVVNKKLRRLHSITFGLDKVYGKIMLRRWRSRQIRLAILSFENQDKFERLKDRIESKMQKIDLLIIKQLR